MTSDSAFYFFFYFNSSMTMFVSLMLKSTFNLSSASSSPLCALRTILMMFVAVPSLQPSEKFCTAELLVSLYNIFSQLSMNWIKSISLSSSSLHCSNSFSNAFSLFAIFDSPNYFRLQLSHRYHRRTHKWLLP